MFEWDNHFFPSRLFLLNPEFVGVLPFILFLIAYPFLKKLRVKFTSFFSHSLILMLIPALAIQIYLIFSSFFLDVSKALDIIHLLQILLFIIPFFGVCLDQYFVHTDSKFLLSNNKELQRINQDKNLLFAIASHDLKNPLSSIVSSCELYFLSHPDINETERLFETIRSNSGYMLGLITDILNLTKLESGENRMQKKLSDLVLCAQRAIDSSRDIAREKGVSLHLESQNISFKLFCDIQLVEQLIRNLLSNALKFTPKGGEIFFELTREGKFVKICCRDSGQGMQQDRINDVLKKEFHTTSKGTSGEQGSGLGISICKRVAELHGGDLTINSIEGNGTSFIVTLLAEESNT